MSGGLLVFVDQAAQDRFSADLARAAVRRIVVPGPDAVTTFAS
jgi:hypothetical protein